MMMSPWLRRAAMVVFGAMLLGAWLIVIADLQAGRWYEGTNWRGMPLFTLMRLVVLVLGTPLLLVIAWRKWK